MDGSGSDSSSGNNRKRKLHSLGSDPSEELSKEQRGLDEDRRVLDVRRHVFETEKESSTKEVLDEREKPKAEREVMTKSGVTDGDVLELNVGGQTFLTQRSTLLLAPEDSHLHSMFSGSSEESLARSKERAIFVDMSPQVFRVILSRLRGSKLRASRPTWGDLKTNDPTFQYELQSVLKHFGLVDPVNRVAMEAGFGGISVVEGLLTSTHVTGFASAISSEEISVDTVWKVHVRSLGLSEWFCAGITSHPNAVFQANSYGWAGHGYTLVNGTFRRLTPMDCWKEEFRANDELIFKLNATSLEMCHARLRRTFIIERPPGRDYKVLLLTFGAGTQVEVSVPTEQEVSRILSLCWQQRVSVNEP